jgi:diadenosine tetraphosphate (Ap4A) HIT family hydrolase
MTCPICSWTQENQEYLFLFETTFWRVVLAPNQCLLGRCVVCLKRHAGDLADLTQAELSDWLEVVKKVETALRSAFGATLFNWSCLMNLAYRESPPDPHVHWWAVPRYDHAVVLEDRVFEDPDFGSPYDHQRRLELPAGVQGQIAERLMQTMTNIQ